MKLKKLFAGLVASAMAVSTMASMTAFEATAAVDIYNADGAWEWTSVVSNASIPDYNFGALGLTSVKINTTCTDINWGWNNAAYYSNANTSGWKQVSFGGKEQNVDVEFESAGDYSVEVPVEPNSGGWFDIGYACSLKTVAFQLNSIDFYAGDTLLGTWEDGKYTVAKKVVNISNGSSFYWVSDNGNGTYNYRYVHGINLDLLDNYKSITYTLSIGTKTASVKTSQYYTGVADTDTETYVLDDGTVVTSVLVKNIPDSIDPETITVSDSADYK